MFTPPDIKKEKDISDLANAYANTSLDSDDIQSQFSDLTEPIHTPFDFDMDNDNDNDNDSIATPVATDVDMDNNTLKKIRLGIENGPTSKKPHHPPEPSTPTFTFHESEYEIDTISETTIVIHSINTPNGDDNGRDSGDNSNNNTTTTTTTTTATTATTTTTTDDKNNDGKREQTQPWHSRRTKPPQQYRTINISYPVTTKKQPRRASSFAFGDVSFAIVIFL